MLTYRNDMEDDWPYQVGFLFLDVEANGRVADGPFTGEPWSQSDRLKSAPIISSECFSQDIEEIPLEVAWTHRIDIARGVKKIKIRSGAQANPRNSVDPIHGCWFSQYCSYRTMSIDDANKLRDLVFQRYTDELPVHLRKVEMDTMWLKPVFFAYVASRKDKVLSIKKMQSDKDGYHSSHYFPSNSSISGDSFGLSHIRASSFSPNCLGFIPNEDFIGIFSDKMKEGMMKHNGESEQRIIKTMGEPSIVFYIEKEVRSRNESRYRNGATESSGPFLYDLYFVYSRTDGLEREEHGYMINFKEASELANSLASEINGKREKTLNKESDFLFDAMFQE